MVAKAIQILLERVPETSSPKPILTVDENGQQTVKQGLQALMSRSDDLVEYNDQQISMSTFF
jgi:hypothetical protein